MPGHYPEVLTIANSIHATPQEVADAYARLGSTHRVADQFGVHQSTVCNFMRAHGLARRRTGAANRIHTLDESFLDCIDTETKAYFVGFFHADGYNGLRNGSMRIALQRRDRELLDRIRTALGASNAIVDFCTTLRAPGEPHPVSREFSRLTIYSRAMSSRLCELGCDNRKSHSPFPNWISADLERHYIRGFCDGNGTICTRGAGIQVSISCREAMAAGMSAAIQRSIGLAPSVHPNGSICVATYSGGNRSRIFLDWLYDGATIYLPRKKQKYDAWLSLRAMRETESAARRSRPCSECNGTPVHARNLCPTCYSRWHRARQ